MFNPASNLNPKTSILDATADLRENINCIKKFGLPLSVAQHIKSRLILNNAPIHDPRTTLDIELNSYIFPYLESYQLS